MKTIIFSILYVLLLINPCLAVQKIQGDVDGNGRLDRAYGGTNHGQNNVYSLVDDFGAECDGVSDDSTELAAALSAIVTGGESATLVVRGLCRIDATTTIIPTNSGSQPSILITGAGTGPSNGATGTPLHVTDGLLFTASPAAGQASLMTYGYGSLDVMGITLKTTGTGALIKTTFTKLRVLNTLFFGSASGADAVNDAIILGGTGWGTANANAYDNFFQGYGSIINGNTFHNIRQVVVLNSAANSIGVTNNTVSTSCGNPTGAAFAINGHNDEDNFGNYFAGNTIELTNYKYAIGLANTERNVFVGNGMYDKTATTTAHFLIGYTTRKNTIITGYYGSTGPIFDGSNPEEQYLIDGSETAKPFSGATYYPTCGATYRGAHYLFKAGTGIQDVEKVCVKNADDSYSWKFAGYPNLGANIVTNGTFDADTGWTKGTGWSIGSGVARKTPGSSGDLYKVITGVAQYKTYEISFDATVNAGSVRFSMGGNTGTYLTASGSWKRIITIQGTDYNAYISANSTFDGSVDNISVKLVDMY